MKLPEWINVKAQKPPRGKRVVLMCIHRNGLCEIGKGVWHGRVYEWTDSRKDGYTASCVKFWMPEMCWIEKEQSKKEGGKQ